MPKIEPNKSGGTVIWNEQDWMEGLAHQGQVSSGTPVKSSVGFSYAINVDPFRNIGYIGPAFNPVAVTNAFTVLGDDQDYPIGITTYNSDYSFILTEGNYGTAKLLKYNNAGTPSIDNGATYPHEIAHGAHTSIKGSDCIAYRHNLGSATRLSYFYSFNDNTDWDVGTMRLTGSFDEFNDDFMSTIPATHLAGTDLTGGKSYPHPMCVGADDVLYIGSGNYVHAYDGKQGADGTFQSQVLTLPQGFVITCFLKSTENLLIGGYYRLDETDINKLHNEAGVYVWNYLDQDITQHIPCDDGYLVNLVNWRGYITAITAGYYSNRGNVRVKLLIGDFFKNVADIPTRYIPIKNGVDIAGNTLFINSNAKIFTVGNDIADDSYEVNQLSYAPGYTSDVSSIVKIMVWSISRRMLTGNNSELSTHLSGYLEAGYYLSNLVEPYFPQGMQGRVKSVDVYFKEDVSGGRSLQVNLKTNFNQHILEDNLATIEEPGIKKYLVDSGGKPLPFFKDIALLLVWSSGSASTSCPTISKVVLEYELVATTSGTQT